MALYPVPTAGPGSSACMDFFPLEGELFGGERDLVLGSLSSTLGGKTE